MSDDDFANTTLDDLISKEMSTRRSGGVGKRFSRGRGRRGFGRRGRGRGRGRSNLRPSSRRIQGFGDRRRGRGSGRRGNYNNNNNRRQINNNNNNNDSWRNDKYEERFHGSVKAEKSNRDDDQYGIPASYNSRSRAPARREPESFTTKSGLQVSVGSGSGNPDLTSSVQINGLHSNVQSEDLREILQKYGPVKHAYITYNEENESNGVGRACFSKVKDAKEAVKDLRDATIDGVAIKITFLGSGLDNNPERRNFSSRRGRGGEERDTMDVDDNNRRTKSSGGFRSGGKTIPDTPMNPLSR